MQDTSIKQELNSVDTLYNQLDFRAEQLYDFVYYYSLYMKEPKDYGTDEMLTAPMAHILTTIEQQPGLTITELAKLRNRTTSAISQSVKILEKKDCIYKQKEKGNNKNQLLYVTEKGKKLSHAHKIYDIHEITLTTTELMQHCSIEEIDTFYKVISIYLKMLTTTT
jgi:DNA-binding MarR family transcriptional regulator